MGLYMCGRRWAQPCNGNPLFDHCTNENRTRGVPYFRHEETGWPHGEISVNQKSKQFMTGLTAASITMSLALKSERAYLRVSLKCA